MKKILMVLLLGCVFAVTGTQIESSISGYVNTDGKSLANGSLNFYVNDGSSTHKNVYSDVNLTTPVGQPIALNSAGLPTSGGVPITLFANGTYRMLIKNSSGSTLYNKSGLKYSGTVDFGGLYIDVASVYGTNDTALSNVIAAIGSTPTTLLFNVGTYTSSTPHTFPGTATLKFMQGAVLNTSVGNTTTISGNIEAGGYQIFTGAGSVSVNMLKNVIFINNWFGYSGMSILDNVSTPITGYYSSFLGLDGSNPVKATSDCFAVLSILSGTGCTGNIQVVIGDSSSLSNLLTVNYSSILTQNQYITIIQPIKKDKFFKFIYKISAAMSSLAAYIINIGR